MSPWFLRRRQRGFTLVEVLVATGLMLFMMLILVQIFSVAAGTAQLSQNLRELDQRVASVFTILDNDLEGVTVTMDPPRDPAAGEGYFELPENSVADLEGEDTDDVLAFTTRRLGGTAGGSFVGLFGFDRGLDGVLGTADDIPRTIESDTAEVIYFWRNGSLYRRQLLVVPTQPAMAAYPTPNVSWNYGGNQDPAFGRVSWYGWFDISARPNPSGGDPIVNTLGDLTKRENRFAHDPRTMPYFGPPDMYPFRAIEYQVNPADPPILRLIHKDRDFNDNNPSVPPGGDPWFGRPLLSETADNRWNLPDLFAPTVPFGTAITDGNSDGLIDYVAGPGPSYGSQSYPYVLRRSPEDLLLTNVLSFDVKVYDPGAPIYVDNAGTMVGPPYDLDGDGNYPALSGLTLVGVGAYVDLGYGANRGPANFYNEALANRAPMFANLANLLVPPLFWHNGARAELPARPDLALKRTYDTWNRAYETDAIDQGGLSAQPDEGTNGVDDPPSSMALNGNGVVDEGPDGLDSDGDNWVDEGTAVGDNLAEQEWESPPPYTVKLRGIQIKIRALDPNTGQAREFTLTHDFVH